MDFLWSCYAVKPAVGPLQSVLASRAGVNGQLFVLAQGAPTGRADQQLTAIYTKEACGLVS